MRETFIKRCIVERTTKAEIRPEEQSEKSRELWGEFMEWTTVERAIRQNRYMNRIKRSGQALLVYVRNINHSFPTEWRRAHGDSQRSLSCVDTICRRCAVRTRCSPHAFLSADAPLSNLFWSTSPWSFLFFSPSSASAVPRMKHPIAGNPGLSMFPLCKPWID